MIPNIYPATPSSFSLFATGAHPWQSPLSADMFLPCPGNDAFLLESTKLSPPHFPYLQQVHTHGSHLFLQTCFFHVLAMMLFYWSLQYVIFS